MKTLSIDLETYSDIDLQSAGVYAYAESPNFEILLLAYSCDGGPVHVIDLARGDMVPSRVVQALTDPEVLKTAYNANFERTCLTKHFEKEMPAEQWEDTMILAAELGLPRTLADVGEAIGLPDDKQKMKEGKALIQYFCKPCKPTKSNGQRTRNMPYHDPVKWETFVEYNKRDVETEMAIRDRLYDYNHDPREHDLWVIDQQINDRGVMLDRQLAQNASDFDDAIKDALKQRVKLLTNLENPNSPVQVKAWIKEQTGVEVASLDKRVIADVKEQFAGNKKVEQYLALRKELGKTSTAKYKAMLTCVCSDDRIRGLTQFYGANRTGRWCLTGDHEVLTPDGWVRLDEFQGGKMLCWNSTTESLSFQKAKPVSFPYEGEMVTYTGQRISQIATPEHRMAVLSKEGLWEERTVEEIGEHRFTIPFTGKRSIKRRPYDVPELRVLIMTQADGHYTEDGAVRFHFKKERKIQRCKDMLDDCSIHYVIQNNDDNTTTITVKPAQVPLWLRMFSKKTFGYWMLDEPPEIIFEELVFWDGYRSAPNSVQYSTTVKQNADVIQACALCAGYSATVKVRNRTTEWSDAYVVNIWLTPGYGTAIRREQVAKITYSGTVYCAETPTGFFPVRRDGKVWITGNSGRHVQMQNLPQNKMDDKDLDNARKLVKGGNIELFEMLYEPANTLSQLIRTSFIPKPGHTFIVADFSAIEARVLAWLAGEKWRQEVFKNGGDIYCASASQMFKVPVVKHGINGHLRQKGKVAELALGYGGSVGALIAMGALDMGLEEDELKPLVNTWRASNPHVTSLWWDVDGKVKALLSGQGSQKLHHRIVFRKEGMLLRIKLPSGRELSYVRPKLNYDGQITYEGIGEQSKWTVQETYGPKLVENIVQAISRDCLAESMRRLTAKGIDIVFHVHDEVICEVPEGQYTVQEISDIMGEPIDWAPGLLLRADGYQCNYYRKD